MEIFSKKTSAIAVLLGTMMGAGILALPGVIAKSGYIIGLIGLFIIGAIMTLAMLYLGEIALRTKDKEQLSGYAQTYLGKKGKILMFIAVTSGIYSALVAYLIGESNSLSYLISGTTNNTLILGIIFWVVVSLITFKGTRFLAKAGIVGVSAVIALIAGITFFYFPSIKIENLSAISLSDTFVPLGVIVFSFLAYSIIPEMEYILRGEKKKMKSAIIISYITGFIVYAIFALVVVGLKGASTPEIATFSIGNIFVLLGITTMSIAYVSLSIALMNNMRFDFGLKKIYAWLITIIIPAILFIILNLSKEASFSKVIGIGGIISGGFTIILILWMIPKAKKYGKEKPAYTIPYSKKIAWIISLAIIAAVIIEVSSLIN